ncbi:MAG: hypothetical protein ACRD2X_27305, partial [Vicinamibacteraceae bacterium]
SEALDLFQSMNSNLGMRSRTMNRRDLRIGTRSLTMMVGAAFIVLSGCTATGGSTLRIPELYVMASTANDARVETRVSVDGRLWATAAGLANANGTPASTLQNTPPGVGATSTGYVIAWFDAAGTLHSQTSPDGVAWTGDMTHGTFSVDALSRPSVVFGGSGTWFAAFSDAAGTPTVLRIRPTTSAPTTVPSLAGARMIGMAYSGGSFFIAHKDGFRVRVLSTTNALAWPASTGTLAVDGDGDVLTSNTWPQLTSSPGTLWLAVDRNSPPGTDGVHHGITTTYTSADGVTWSDEHSYEPTHGALNTLGLALAGPQSAQILADHSTGQTSLFHSDGWSTAVATHSSWPVSLAWGPKAPTSIRTATVTFRRFKRMGPSIQPVDPSASEDVTLVVEHLDSGARLVKRHGPWECRRAVKDTGHFFSQFDPSGRSPEIRFAAQSGDLLRVRMSGDNGEVTGDIAVSDLRGTPAPANGERLIDATQPSNRIGYQVWFTSSL